MFLIGMLASEKKIINSARPRGVLGERDQKSFSVVLDTKNFLADFKTSHDDNIVVSAPTLYKKRKIVLKYATG